MYSSSFFVIELLLSLVSNFLIYLIWMTITKASVYCIIISLPFFWRCRRFTEWQRNNDFAIYLKENNVPANSYLYYYCYEVIKIRKREAESFKRFGKSIELPLREIYPTDNNWGLYGWTFEDLITAEVYFIKLIEKVSSATNLKVKNNKLNEYQLDIFSSLK